MVGSVGAVGSAGSFRSELGVDGPGDPEYGKSTSIEPVATADRGEMPNVDVSKNAALIPPTFGAARTLVDLDIHVQAGDFQGSQIAAAVIEVGCDLQRRR